jgi:hypothetical protein
MGRISTTYEVLVCRCLLLFIGSLHPEPGRDRIRNPSGEKGTKSEQLRASRFRVLYLALKSRPPKRGRAYGNPEEHFVAKHVIESEDRRARLIGVIH